MSFEIDNTSASDLSVKLKSDYQEPGTPEVRKKQVAIPGRAGQYDFGTEYDVRTFELPLVTLNTSSESEVQSVIRDFADKLTDDEGKPKEVELSFTKESDKHYKVRLDDQTGITRHPGGFADFTVNLIAVEPYAFSDTSTTTVNITGSPQTFDVTNSGSAPTPMVMTFTNTGSNTVSGFTIKTA